MAAVDTTVLSLRRACPGTLIGVSTGAWIENDEVRTLDCIAQWNELPDYASVNLSEHDAPAKFELLGRRGIGVEAGFASVADAERLVKLPGHRPVLRILIEIEEQDLGVARPVAESIAAVLDRAGLRRPILLHGVDATVWPFVELARQRRWSTRVGLEDGKHLPDGTIASDNAALVTAGCVPCLTAKSCVIRTKGSGYSGDTTSQSVGKTNCSRGRGTTFLAEEAGIDVRRSSKTLNLDVAAGGVTRRLFSTAVPDQMLGGALPVVSLSHKISAVAGSDRFGCASSLPSYELVTPEHGRWSVVGA